VGPYEQNAYDSGIIHGNKSENFIKSGEFLVKPNKQISQERNLLCEVNQPFSVTRNQQRCDMR
jgi:hypothetical protein